MEKKKQNKTLHENCRHENFVNIQLNIRLLLGKFRNKQRKKMSDSKLIMSKTSKKCSEKKQTNKKRRHDKERIKEDSYMPNFRVNQVHDDYLLLH